MSRLEDVLKQKEDARYAEKMSKAKAIAGDRQELADRAFKNWIPDGKVYKINEGPDGSFCILKQRVIAAKISSYSGEHDSWGRYPSFGYSHNPKTYSREKIEEQSIEPVIRYDVIYGDQVTNTVNSAGKINTERLPMRFNIYQDAVDYVKRITKRPEEKETYFNANGELVS